MAKAVCIVKGGMHGGGCVAKGGGMGMYGGGMHGGGAWQRGM